MLRHREAMGRKELSFARRPRERGATESADERHILENGCGVHQSLEQPAHARSALRLPPSAR
jgi:hypothetical protein